MLPYFVNQLFCKLGYIEFHQLKTRCNQLKIISFAVEKRNYFVIRKVSE
jgi:hypothetical protein